MVSLALRRDLEIAGGHRRVDRPTRGDDTRYRADDRRCDRQPDSDRRHHWYSAGDCGITVVLERDILV